MNFKLHTIDSAPDAAKPNLQAAEKAYGTIPNLFKGFAASPASLKVYMAMNEALQTNGLLTPVEQQVAYLTISAENGCTYCVGAHSVLAGMANMPDNILTELREQRPLSDPKLNALRNFALSLEKHQGHVPQADLDAFEAAGYGQGHVLDVLTILAQKTLSNYFNHMAETPLDEMFKPGAWQPAA